MGTDGKRNPDMRQRAHDGKSFIKMSRGQPQSNYMRRLCAVFSEGLLSALDEVVATAPPTLADFKQALGNELLKLVPEEMEGVVVRLVKLAVKKLATPCEHAQPLDRLRGASELWGRIVERTDLLYVATEDLLPKFEKVVPLLIGKLGAAAEDVVIVLAPGLKDPVRVHEKALDEYVHDFGDWDDNVVIPEACVLDMIRGRAVCTTGSTMLQLQQMLMAGVTLEVDGEQVTLESARNKIKFAGADLDPMHFRNILNNLIFTVGRRSVFVELQLHHSAIYEHNESSHAHDRYDYFRSALSGQYQQGLDQVRIRVPIPGESH